MHGGGDGVGPGGGGVEGDGRCGEQPGGVPQQRQRDTEPGQQQVQGEQHADAGVDADGEDVGEVSEAFVLGEVADGGVGAGEADPGDDDGAGGGHADEQAMHTCQLR